MRLLIWKNGNKNILNYEFCDQVTNVKNSHWKSSKNGDWYEVKTMRYFRYYLPVTQLYSMSIDEIKFYIMKYVEKKARPRFRR